MRPDFLFFGTLLLLACEKGEIPVQPHQSGDALINSVEMGDDYRYQLFFSLNQNKVISSNLKTDWDLAFETADTGWHVKLNTSKGMAVSKKSGTFGAVTDTSGCNWEWDAHSGNHDSTAIGNWQDYGGIYIIDRGYDQAGLHQGFSKIQLNSVSVSEYLFNYGNLNSVNPTSKTILKNANYTFTCFNLSSGEVVSVAPPSTNWDLQFTQYTHLFEGPTPYLVTGVLLNPFKTQSCVVDDMDYAEITYETAAALLYSSDANSIGYNWKYFNYTEGIYQVDPTKIFLIKTQNEYFYKFHFIDFYNDSGVKGYPKFEFGRL